MLPSVFGEKLFDDMFNDAFTLVPLHAIRRYSAPMQKI